MIRTSAWAAVISLGASPLILRGRASGSVGCRETETEVGLRRVKELQRTARLFGGAGRRVEARGGGFGKTSWTASARLVDSQTLIDHADTVARRRRARARGRVTLARCAKLRAGALALWRHRAASDGPGRRRPHGDDVGLHRVRVERPARPSLNCAAAVCPRMRSRSPRSRSRPIRPRPASSS